ncbi:MAG TPA: phosphonate C-P lyase system protein PhnL [Desulfotignum sp.]|nr:phosphonate C-P lyase system protein PhnL [Desulfotignum sp.]
MIDQTFSEDVMTRNWILKLENIEKDFVFHLQQGTRIVVFDGFSHLFFPGRASILTGPSGSGKSTLLRMIYGTYRTGGGHIWVRHRNRPKDIAAAAPAMIYTLRQDTIGYVSQFLRVVPRVSALDTVIEPLLARNMDLEKARKKGRALLERLNIPSTMWHLSATTFSGGEQQRINLARGFIAPFPILLLDEPTASLDLKNRRIVIELIKEALADNTCVIGVFHDPKDHRDFADHTINLAHMLNQEVMQSCPGKN